MGSAGEKVIPPLLSDFPGKLLPEKTQLSIWLLQYFVYSLVYHIDALQCNSSIYMSAFSIRKINSEKMDRVCFILIFCDLPWVIVSTQTSPMKF